MKSSRTIPRNLKLVTNREVVSLFLGWEEIGERMMYDFRLIPTFRFLDSAFREALRKAGTTKAKALPLLRAAYREEKRGA